MHAYTPALRTLLATSVFALALAAIPHAAHAGSITLNSGSATAPLTDGVLANGTSLLLVNADPATPITAQTTYTLDTANGAPCGDYTLPSAEAVPVTAVQTTRSAFSFYVRSKALKFIDANGSSITPAPVPCTAAVRVSGGADMGTVNVPMTYPRGQLGFANAQSPTVALRQAVVPGDGTSTVKLSIGTKRGNAIDPILLSNGEQAPPDATIRAKLLPRPAGLSGGTLQSSLGSVRDTFSVGDDGKAQLVIQAPEVSGANDLVMTLRVWAEYGDATSATEDLTVRFLAPGYAADTMLTLPFEDSFGGFTAASRGTDPLPGSTALVAANKAAGAGVRDFALRLTGTERLSYPAASSINPGEGTISFWIRPAATTRSSAMSPIALTETNGTILGSAGVTLTTTHVISVGALSGSAGPFTSTKYRHVAYAWSSGSQKLYIDGVQVDDDPAGPSLPSLTGRAMSVGGGYAGDIDQLLIYARELRPAEIANAYEHGTEGVLNENTAMFSTVGFETGGAIGLLGKADDAREQTADECYDADEQVGVPTARCDRGLSARPQAPVRVTQCSIDDGANGRKIVACAVGDPSQNHEGDALYLAEVGTQQFGRGSVGTLGSSYDTDEPSIPHAGYNAAPSIGLAHFASPIATRFRLPPKDIPPLVVCNFPAVAGEEYNLADMEGYIFEDHSENHYTTGKLAGRFKCVPPGGSLADLEALREHYGFVLKDNTGAQMTQGWTFTFKPKDDGVNDVYFDLRTYYPLNDSLATVADDFGRPYVSREVKHIIDNAARGDGSGLALDAANPPVFTIAPESSLFNFSLPATETRNAAMTIIPSANDPESATSLGFSEMHDVVLRFSAPGAAGDAAAYFETSPFTIRYETFPAAPTYLHEDFLTDGACEDYASLPVAEQQACDLRRATELRIVKPQS